MRTIKENRKRKRTRNACMAALCTVGTLAVMALASEAEVTPDNMAQILGIKAVAVAALGGCVLAGKRLAGKGLLPDCEE